MYKVVLADDEPHILNYLKNFISWEELQLQVVGATSNGKEAYDIALSQKANILITDIRMPEMDGLQPVSYTHLPRFVQSRIIDNYGIRLIFSYDFI